MLLGELEERFQDHLDEAATAPPFASVVEEYLALYPPLDPHADAADAIAEFARPLLDEADVTDLDAFDRQMELAHALWDAAHAPDPPSRQEHLEQVRDDFGIDDPEALLRTLLSASR